MKYSGHNNITFFLHFYWLFLPDVSDVMLNLANQYVWYSAAI